MADDAAGAVRRTPRPAPEPDVDELVDQTQMLGFNVERGVATLSLKPPHEIVLAWVDAARAMLGDAPNYSETRIDFPTEKAEMEVSAAGSYERFVFTVQRAGKVTPHEARQKAEAERDLAVWLHAEAAWRVAGFDAITVKLAQINQQVTAERDEAVALCANLQITLLSRLAELTEASGKQRSTEWLRTCATLPMEEWPPAPAYKGPMVPAAERDALQARLDAALALMDFWDEHGGSIPQGHRLRAALQGDQPAEPEVERPKTIGDSRCRHGNRPLWCAVCAGEAPEPTGEVDR